MVRDSALLYDSESELTISQAAESSTVVSNTENVRLSLD